MKVRAEVFRVVRQRATITVDVPDDADAETIRDEFVSTGDQCDTWVTYRTNETTVEEWEKVKDE